jgi:hypothetical protein
MASNSNFPCPNCHRWFTNQKSFWHHIRACRRAIETKTSAGIATIAANPLLSIANTSITQPSFTLQSDVDDHQSQKEVQNNNLDYVYSPSEDADGPNQDEDGPNHPFQECAFQPLQRKPISANNLDVMLHDLLLKHKASLLLYDEICNLFNSYLASPEFDRFAKLKTRKALIRSTQKSLNTECL